jgi:hypothetical protein
MEVAIDVTLSQITTEREMGAAASNNLSNPTHKRKVLRMDHGSAGDGS